MSKPNRDRSGALRNVFVGFRVSQAEDEMIESLVAMSGMTKQDYIISKLLDREVTVIPSSRVHAALKQKMEDVYLELRRIRDASEMPLELAEVTENLSREFIGLGRHSAVEEEEHAVKSFRRE